MSVAWSAVLVIASENVWGLPGRVKKRASEVRFPSWLVSCWITGGSQTTTVIAMLTATERRIVRRSSARSGTWPRRCRHTLTKTANASAMTTPGTSPTCVCTAKDATSANHGAAHQSRHATDQASSSTSTKGSSVTLGFQMSNGIGSITTMYAVRRSDAHTRRGRPPRRSPSARIPTAVATLIAVVPSTSPTV